MCKRRIAIGSSRLLVLSVVDKEFQATIQWNKIKMCIYTKLDLEKTGGCALFVIHQSSKNIRNSKRNSLFDFSSLTIKFTKNLAASFFSCRLVSSLSTCFPLFETPRFRAPETRRCTFFRSQNWEPWGKFTSNLYRTLQINLCKITTRFFCFSVALKMYRLPRTLSSPPEHSCPQQY